MIIGAVKGGTTSLYHYLAQHPDVFVSPTKEPSFFAYEGHPLDFCGPKDQELGAPRFAVTEWGRYQALFAGRKNQGAVGEASPVYLYHPDAPRRMSDRLPGVRLVAILRDPAARAFSNYAMFVRDHRETLPFRRALRECEARQRAHWTHGWQYLELGFYARQLARYYTLFDPAQIKVVFYEDLAEQPERLLREVFSFLQVDPTFPPDIGQRHNASLMKRRWLDRVMNHPGPTGATIRRLLPASIRRPLRQALSPYATYRLRLKPADRAFLVEHYRTDIMALQRMTGRNLSAWLS